MFKWQKKIYLVFVLTVAFTKSALTQEKLKINFGGIFENDIENGDPSIISHKEAFESAIVVSNGAYQTYDFVYDAIHDNSFYHRTGPFKATLEACSLIEQQALVIFGPQHPDDIFAVQSVCDCKDIAHVITRWIPNPEEHRSIINFSPNSDDLLDAFFAVLKSYGWSTFTLLYEDNDSLLRIGNLINLAKNDGFIVRIMQLTNTKDEEEGVYRKTLKQAVHSGQKHYVIDCKIEILQEVLNQLQQVGMMTSGFNYFITNLDLQIVDLEPFRYSEANITGIRIFDPSSEYAETWNKFLQIKRPDFDINKMKTETALIIDAVSVLTNIIGTKISLSEMELKSISCNSVESGKYGFTITNHVKTSINKGLTGLIEFDRNGFRSNFNLDIIEVRETEIAKISTWNSTSGIVNVPPQLLDADSFSDSLKNKSFKVVTTLIAPHCMLKETSVQLLGNDRFEGFAIDLIDELAKMEGFNYTFYIREDKQNGNITNGVWTGIIGDIINKKYDLGITDLTITEEREKAVDFTSPFMNLGISILAKKPENAPPSFFSFADPFALDTWVMIAVAYAVVGVSLFILGRLSPDEWTNPYACIEEPEFLRNQFTLSNSFWYAMGGLLQQGSEIAAIGVSTRMLSGMWWLFILVMVSSYTANLAAFLATENPQNLFTDVKSLLENREIHGIKVGAKAGGATEGFFKKGKDNNEIYRKVAEAMASDGAMTSDNDEGVKLAENSTYAFFMESISIEYETQRHCNLKQYGNLLDDKGYGIAMRKNSTYRTKLSTAILKLQTSGQIDKIKRRWWEEKRGGGQCLANSGDDATPSLKVKNVEGVVYITIGGTVASVFVVIVEFLFRALRVSRKTNVSLKEVLRIEMKSYLEFNSNVKPPIRPKSQSRSKSRETGTSNNNLIPTPAPYGFVPALTKEESND